MISNAVQSSIVHTQAARALKPSSKATNLASIICSRESTYRTTLDLVAFDFPIMLAAAFRNFTNFVESTFECFYGTAILFSTPYIATGLAETIGKMTLPKNLQEDAIHLMKFSMKEAKSTEGIKEGLERIATEEVQDKDFISSLYEKASNRSQAQKFKDQAEEIKDFASRFKVTDESAKHIYGLKKKVILIESFIEGSWASSVSFATRMFRKHVLHSNTFTGTSGYLTEEESTSLGEDEELSTKQKLLSGSLCFLSPLINTVLLGKVEGAESSSKGDKGRFLNTVEEQIDMTHGVYPKLGLLLFTMPPKWTGHIFLSQGSFERFEKTLKFFTVVLSWWFGHRFTNGIFAKNEDEKLAKKYGIEKGVLVDKNYYEKPKEENFFMKLRNKYPEPTKINEVFQAAENANLSEEKKDELIQEAEEAHAKCLYKGFAAHSAVVWGLSMAVNQITKVRAERALAA